MIVPLLMHMQVLDELVVVPLRMCLVVSLPTFCNACCLRDRGLKPGEVIVIGQVGAHESWLPWYRHIVVQCMQCCCTRWIMHVVDDSDDSAGDLANEHLTSFRGMILH